MRSILLCLTLLGLLAPNARAENPDTLDEVEVQAHTTQEMMQRSAASEDEVGRDELENRPLLRPAEVLERVPGLLVSQHSGDGKANQYYLRGFNLDHGTDFATTLMGMPLNLPTHAHGQGYLDLQFLIPELVDFIHYRKGPYHAETGDFSSAGSAHVEYLRRLDQPFAQVTLGAHNYRRTLLAGSPDAAGGKLLYALEWMKNDGPWVVPQNLGKLNGLLRLSEGTRDNGWSLAAMTYQSQWDSTDQVPQRAVNSGLISHYGSLDPTDGGITHRHSLSASWSALDAGGWTRANAYAVDYALDLWSNFTFCTLGCGTGDQFQQSDRRRVYGADAAHTWSTDWGGTAVTHTVGVQTRLDDIGTVGLYTTSARRIWGTVREDAVKQGNLSLYGESRVQWLDTFASTFGLRGDLYRFDVNSRLTQNSGSASASLLSPKLALQFGPWEGLEYFLNAGSGFHSNDARGATTHVNPDFRDPAYLSAVQPVTPLARSKGYEVGLRYEPQPGLHHTLSLWQLDIASELIFVGDAGITSPSFPSRRSGIEWSSGWTPHDGLHFDLGAGLSHARFVNYDPARIPGPYIPGAAEQTLSSGLGWQGDGPWSGGARLRYFGPRALIEDNSVRSKPSTLVNLQGSYRVMPGVKLTLDLLNLFDTRVSDIDYYYASQLPGEAAPVNDIHSHPAEPRTVRLSLRVAY
jgi:hypothetical protein